MPSATMSGPLGTLRIEQDFIPIHYESDLDANWRFTDANGHEHYCVYDGGDHYPTLRQVYQEPFYCDTCHEVHEDLLDHYECKLCGEHVSPGSTGPGMKYILGMRSAYLDDEPISGERAEDIMRQYAEAAETQRRERDAAKVMDGFGIPRALRDQWNKQR